MRKPLTLSTAKINPARRLYEGLGFTVVGESEFKVFMERKPTWVDAVVREERTGDIAAITEVHAAAFKREAEGRLVERLRSDGLIVASIVALVNSKVVANAVFSKLAVTPSRGAITAVALAPVAVAPAYQRRGLGSIVIRFGLQLCGERGYDAVFVLGDPVYYMRFGFSSEIAKGMRSPYSGAGSSWMALELRPLTLCGLDGEVRYPTAFSIVD